MTYEIFYIGDKYYSRSSTMMSSIYHAGTYASSDWAEVPRLVSQGHTVTIRMATAAEIQWADAELSKYLLRQIERLQR